MITENNHYDVFIAYSKHDLGEKCSDVIYSWLTEHYPLKVFLDKESSNNKISTINELEESDSIILILTKDTLGKLEEDLSKEYTSEVDKPGLIRELDTISRLIKKEQKENNIAEEDIENTPTFRRIIAINIHEKNVTEGYNHFPNREIEKHYKVYESYKFLKYLSYIPVDYNDKFNIDFESLKESDPLAKNKRIIDIIDKTDNIIRKKEDTIKNNEKKHRRNTIIIAALSLATAMLIGSIIISYQKKTINNHKSPIILVGGSTSKAKLLETYKPNSDDNVAFIHIPSQTAWSLMTETYKDSTYKDSIFIDKHHTIILSSQDIILDSILDYNTQRKMIHDDYRILDLQLESVPLRVAIFPKNHKIINKIKTFPSIDKSTLLKLTNDTNAILVTTSEKSGTLYAFREVLNNDTLLGENLEPNRGYRLSEYISNDNTGTKYVIALQNASYGFTDTDKVSLFSVTDDNNKEIEIPIHLYTLVELNKHNNAYYFKDSDDRIKEILHDIGWDYRYIIKGNAEPTKSIPLDTSDLFIKLSYSPKK